MTHRKDIRRINLQELVNRISEINKIEEIYIFGSRRYETGSLRSDIDILVYAPQKLRFDEFLPIWQSEKALDIFETIDKQEARSFANDSTIKRDDVIVALDAILLWSKKDGYSPQMDRYKEIQVQRDIDFKMSYMPMYSEAENKFYEEYGHNAVFVIMPFREDLNTIYDIIKTEFNKHGYKAIRADEMEFTEDLWDNVKVYLDCCKIAVAIFNKDNQENYNPNVALEVGYMLSKGAKVCLLKDSELPKLPTDLISKMYKEYDSDKIETTLPQKLESWIKNYLR